MRINKAAVLCLASSLITFGPRIAISGGEPTEKEMAAEKAQREEQRIAAEHAGGRATEKQNAEAREKAEKASREAEKERQERQSK